MPSHNRSLHPAWAAAVFLLLLFLAASVSSVSAEETKDGQQPALETQGDTPPGVEAALKFLEFVGNTVNSANEEHAASPHEPPGKPEDRPPGHANNDGQKDPKEGPPGQPDDRPSGDGGNEPQK
jgi:hypothetical protein